MYVHVCWYALAFCRRQGLLKHKKFPSFTTFGRLPNQCLNLVHWLQAKFFTVVKHISSAGLDKASMAEGALQRLQPASEGGGHAEGLG